MKKSRILLIVSALCIVVFCVSLFTYWRHFTRIDADAIEKIVVWTYSHSNCIEIDADDAERFLELYNASRYGGQANGEGGTPEFGVIVSFLDGTALVINDFNCLNHHFEVFLRGSDVNDKAYYVDSEKLYAFVSELTEKYC